MLCGVGKGWSSRCLAWVTALDLNLFLLFQADVRDEEALYQAFQGVDCVFHVASYGMSGTEKVRLPHTPRGGHSSVQVLPQPPPSETQVFIPHCSSPLQRSTRNPWPQTPVLVPPTWVTQGRSPLRVVPSSGKEERHCNLGYKLFREHCSGVYKNAFRLTQIILIYILITSLLIIKHQQ